MTQKVLKRLVFKCTFLLSIIRIVIIMIIEGFFIITKMRFWFFSVKGLEETHAQIISSSFKKISTRTSTFQNCFGLNESLSHTQSFHTSSSSPLAAYLQQYCKYAIVNNKCIRTTFTLAGAHINNNALTITYIQLEYILIWTQKKRSR